MRVVWMIFYLKEREIAEHKSHTADETHYFRSVELWDDHEYNSEEDALTALSESVLDHDDYVFIQKVYVK